RDAHRVSAAARDESRTLLSPDGPDAERRGRVASRTRRRSAASRQADGARLGARRAAHSQADAAPALHAAALHGIPAPADARSARVRTRDGEPGAVREARDTRNVKRSHGATGGARPVSAVLIALALRLA